VLYVARENTYVHAERSGDKNVRYQRHDILKNISMKLCSVILSRPKVNLAGERRDARANGTYDVALRAQHSQSRRSGRRRRHRM